MTFLRQFVIVCLKLLSYTHSIFGYDTTVFEFYLQQQLGQTYINTALKNLLNN